MSKNENSYKMMIGANSDDESLLCGNVEEPIKLDADEIVIYTYNVGVRPNMNDEPLKMNEILANLKLKNRYICLLQEVSYNTNLEFIQDASLSKYYLSQAKLFNTTEETPTSTYTSILLSPDFEFVHNSDNKPIYLDSNTNKIKIRTSGIVRVKHIASGIIFALVSIHRSIADNPIQPNEPKINKPYYSKYIKNSFYELYTYILDYEQYTPTNIIMGGDFNFNLLHYANIVDSFNNKYKDLLSNNAIKDVNMINYIKTQLSTGLNKSSSQHKSILNIINTSLVDISYPSKFITTIDSETIYSRYLDFILVDGPNFQNPNGKAKVGRICTSLPSDHHIIYRIIKLNKTNNRKIIGGNLCKWYTHFILY